MIRLIKSIAKHILPDRVIAPLLAVNGRKVAESVERRLGLDEVNRRYEVERGRLVKSGPFAGMEYTDLTSHRHITQRLLGCYELELHEIVEGAIRTGYREIIDIGCAEGYYAVGFALRMPKASVVAFDTDPWARRVCRQLAKLNGVTTRVTIKGFCSSGWLRRNAREGAFVISDCEGYESVLFDPETVACLRGVDLLIELHKEAPAFDNPVVRRFRETHTATLIPSRERTAEDWRGLDFLKESERRLAVSDMREPWQGWVFLKSKHCGQM